MLGSIVLGNKLEDLTLLNDWLSARASQNGWSDELKHNVRLCLNEAVTNTISYGFKGCAKPSIRISIRKGEGRLEVVLEDNGQAYNPLQHVEMEEHNSLEDIPIGGFGIGLMKQFSDEITYERAGTLNSLRFLWRS